MPKGLVVAVAASSSVHLGALVMSAAGWLGGSSSDVAEVLDRPVSLSLVITDRPVPAPSGGLVTAATDPRDTQAADTPVRLEPRSLDARAAVVGPLHAAPPVTDALPEPALPSMSTAVPELHGEPQVADAHLSDVPTVDGYVLRKALSAPPVPRDEVKLSWPAGWFMDGRQTGVFSVFIDEDGRIQRMVIDGPTLAPALEEAAILAFTAARFEPGRVAGRAVKSLIRIEVEFTEETPVAGAPVVVSRKLL